MLEICAPAGPPTTTWRRLRLALGVVAVTLGLLAGPSVLSAHAEGTASTFVVDANLAKDGTLRVKQTITFTGTAPAQLTQKLETRRNLLGNRHYEYAISDVTATSKGAPLNPETTEDGSFTSVTVPTNGASEIVMGYTVTGAVVNIEGGTALQWQVLQGLSAQVTEFSATVAIPGNFSYVKCTSGNPNATTPCAFAAAGTEDSQVPTFRDGPLGENQVVAVDIGFPPQTVTSNESIKDQWTVGRAFSADPLPLGLALGLLLLGGLGLLALHRRAGTDATSGGQITKAGEFVPTGPGESEFRVVGEVRPGHVGTVVDERVDPIDITATLLDLAVRGHLLITELPRSTAYARSDWVLTRRPASAALSPFEVKLLDGMAPVGGQVRVSELSQRVQESIGAVQDQLYDEVVQKGWFEQRPDATRNRYLQGALVFLVVAVVLTGLLAAFTTFGLVGLALVVLGLGLVFVGQEMPSRTAKGSALLAGLGALRSDLLSHPTDQMPKGREVSEMAEVLPYAVVLGGAERWLDAIVT
ncbi:MAG TPA: DUF2207 domain-containing protein, partial [Propionibacteriaceae bacterium]